MRRIFQLRVAFCGQIVLSLTNTCKISGRFAQLSSLHQKTNRERTAHPSDFMSGKPKKVEILKNEAQSQVKYSDKNACFDLKLLFKCS